MKAVVYHRYGSPDVLEVEDIAKPVPGDDEVLIEIRAASVNPYDRAFMTGLPFFARIMTGLRKPKSSRLGVDVAGRVEAVGRNVTQLAPGDEVFGACRGAFAEYSCASESRVVRKPPNLTFEQAGAVTVAAMTALQALRDRGRIQPGQKVLINGASGGVGTFAVQLAKWLGAEVTGVCSTQNVELVRSLGADRVIDYIRENFTKRAERYDAILDNIGNHSLLACRRVLKPKGTYLAVGGMPGRWISPLPRVIGMLILSRFVSQTLAICMTKSTREHLTLLGELLEAGKITPAIDRVYELREIREAMQYLGGHHARAKVVIRMSSP